MDKKCQSQLGGDSPRLSRARAPEDVSFTAAGILTQEENTTSGMYCVACLLPAVRLSTDAQMLKSRRMRKLDKAASFLRFAASIGSGMGGIVASDTLCRTSQFSGSRPSLSITRRYGRRRFCFPPLALTAGSGKNSEQHGLSYSD